MPETLMLQIEEPNAKSKLLDLVNKPPMCVINSPDTECQKWLGWLRMLSYEINGLKMEK